MFRVLKMVGEFWGVFLVNSNDENDRYLLTSTFEKQSDADHFAAEFQRIANASRKYTDNSLARLLSI